MVGLVRLGILLLTGGTACNWVYGLEGTALRPMDDAALGPDADPRIDLDRDGRKDVEDPCIAPATDLLVDSDYDGTVNEADLCPLDKRATPDSDGDGVGDLCDPAPGEPDRLRCMMAFTDPDLDVRMWIARDAAAAWTLYYPRMLFAYTEGSIVADWSFEPSTGPTTFAIAGRLFAGSPNLSLLARAQRDPESPQVDCRMRSTASGWQLVATGGTPVALGVAASTTTSIEYWMHATVTPGAADGVTLRCQARLGTANPVSVESSAALPFGTLGFSGSRASVSGIAVYSRSDAP